MGERLPVGSLHVYISLEPKPTDASLLDSAQLLCAHFAKAVHTSFPGADSSFQLSSVSSCSPQYLSSLFFAVGKNIFRIFPEAKSSKDVVFFET